MPNLDWNAGMYMGGTPWKSCKDSKVTVTTSATLLPATNLANRSGIWIWNTTATAIYISTSSELGTTNEASVAPGGSLLIAASDKVTWFARVANGTSAITVWEFIVG